LKNRYLLWCIFFFIFLGTSSSQPYINVYLKELGYSPIPLSFVLASVYFTMAFTEIFAPSILKKLGLKKGIMIGAPASCLFAFFLFAFKNLGIFILGAIIWGFGACILWASVHTMLLKISNENRYGIEIGYLRFFVQVGLLIGSFVLGQIAIISNFRNLFLVAFFFTFSGFLFTFFLEDVKTSFSKFNFNTAFSKKLTIFTIAMFISVFGYGLVVNQLNFFIAEKFSISFLSKIIVLFYLSAGILSFFGGKLIDKTGEIIIPFLFFLFSGLFLIIFSFYQSIPLSIFSIIFIGGLYEIVPIAITVRIGKIIPENKRANTISSTFLWRDFGIGASIFLLGLMRSKFTYQKNFIIMGIIFVLMGIVFLFSFKNEKKFN